MITRTQMNISVSGVNDPKFKKELIRASVFYLGTLISKRLMNHISLDIVVKRPALIEDNADGYCEITGHNTLNKPREFTIEIARNKSKRYMMMTLAHEIVHLKQYALGELHEDTNAWKGKRYDSKAYWNTPWEIEAYGRERGLYFEYCDKFGTYFEESEKERDN